jgi:hypothetical protein
MPDRPKVHVGEPRELSMDEFLALADEEEQAEQEEARAAWGHDGHRLTITIPVSLGPIERLVRFEEPLTDALGDDGIVLGGGTAQEMVDGSMKIVEVDIGVRVRSLDEGLATIQACLKAQGAPARTTIRTAGDSDETVYRLDAE